MNNVNLPSFRVHVIDDDAALRTALSRVLMALGYLVSMYDSAAAFLASVSEDEPACILLDVNMPGVTGLQLQDELRRAGHPMPVIFLTGHGDVAMSVRAVKAGAEDFLLKPVQREALIDAIERARARATSARLQLGESADLRARLASLTPREREVFEMVAQGMLNKQIAYKLGNTERTVKAQRGSVMEKMQVGSVAELVLAAARLGIIRDA